MQRLLPIICMSGRHRAGGVVQQVVDVLVDIDATLVYPAGGSPNASGADSPCAGSSSSPGVANCNLLDHYSLAHGALEFLAALDQYNSTITHAPGAVYEDQEFSATKNPIRIRIGLYSCGPKARNQTLAKALVEGMDKRLGYRFAQKLEAFSVPNGNRGKKIIKGLRRGLDLRRAIVVDDGGRNVYPGEESNLLKIYDFASHSHDSTDVYKLYRARLCNNLVRALGMILMSIDAATTSHASRSGGNNNTTVVQALHNLQWDSHNMYLHASSNAKIIYQQGLKAMQALNPNFCLAYPTTSPWSDLCLEADKEVDAVFPRRQDLIIRDCTDALIWSLQGPQTQRLLLTQGQTIAQSLESHSTTRTADPQR